MQEINALFAIAVLILSVIVHEVSHGYAALAMGDETARRAGRLTLNPLKHLDPIGSVALPILFSLISPRFIFGWARPVPYNENNLRNKKWGTILVSAAGVIANLAIALFFALFIRIGVAANFITQPLFFITATIVSVNLALFVFNLLPFPPLDGSRILFAVLPVRFGRFERILEQYGIFVIFALVVAFPSYFSRLLSFLFSLFVGSHL